MINILNNEPLEYSDQAISILSNIGNYYDQPNNATIHAIITRLQEHIDVTFLNKYPELKFILTATTGLDHIDLTECQKRQITIISLKGENAFLSSIAATAEHTITLLLSLIRNIPNATAEVRQGHWDRMKHKGHELKNKTICILGMGRLGIQVARIATAFQMNVKGFDIKQNIQYPCTTNLLEALTGTDIISIHLPYEESTSALINKEQILSMNPDSYIINTSRGQILNETDVVECLQTGHLAGVAGDVLENEYNIHNSPIWRHSKETKASNILITPHIGGCTYESMAATEIFIAQKFVDLIGSLS